MRIVDNIRIDAEPSGEELKAACEHLVRELLEEVRHGFGDITVSVETTQSKKKAITIKSGKSYRFVV